MLATDWRILASDWHILGDLASILGTTPHTKKGVALPQNDNARLPKTATDSEYLQPDRSSTLAMLTAFPEPAQTWSALSRQGPVSISVVQVSFGRGSSS